MRRCAKCVVPETFPESDFNAQGVCRYCVTHDPAAYKVKGKQELDAFLGPFRNSTGRHDCVVGVSGGGDSTYALYYLVEVCNLRVLAYTTDNGFVSDVAKDNMKRALDALGVELVRERHNSLKKCLRHNIPAWVRAPSPAMIGVLCTGCDPAIHSGLRRCTESRGIPLAAFGAASPERSLERCCFKDAFIRRNALGRAFGRNGSLSILAGLLYEIIRNPRYVLSPSLTDVYVGEYLHRFHGDRIQRLLYPHQSTLYLYDYIDWDESEILSTIRRELAWQTPADSASPWHFDCKVNFFVNYLFRETVGFTQKDHKLSVMVRQNMITREDALERLRDENPTPEWILADFLSEIGMSRARLEAAVDAVRTSERKRRRA